VVRNGKNGATSGNGVWAVPVDSGTGGGFRLINVRGNSLFLKPVIDLFRNRSVCAAREILTLII
jgi:hypothetical protein